MRAAVREGLRGLVGGQRRKNRSFWVDDLHINSCYECDTQFSFVNRKHHCRACGRVFCGRCTVYSLLLAGQGGLFPAGLNEADEPARVCQHCNGILIQKHKQQQLEQKPGALPAPPSAPGSGEVSVDPLLAPTLWPVIEASWPPSSRGGGSVAGATERPEAAACESEEERETASSSIAVPVKLRTTQQPPAPARNNREPSLPQPIGQSRAVPASSTPPLPPGDDSTPSTNGKASSPSLLLARTSAGMEASGAELREHRSAPSTPQVSKVEQPSSPGHPSATARPASVSEGQRPPPRKPAINSASSSSSLSSDSQAFPQPNLDAKKVEAKRPRRMLACPGGMKKLLADMNVTWCVPPAVEGAMDAEEILPVRPVAEMLLRAGADGELPELPEEENTSWYSGAEHLRAAFARATMDHCSEIARQLLVSEGFDQDGEWLPIVQRLAAEAVSGVDPRATGPIGNFDICFYIKVECMAGVGQPAGSSVVKGVAARMNPAMRSMPRDIRNPRIMLLGGSVEYHRTMNRLCSLDTIVQQEKEHLRNSVSRIKQYEPDVVMVERTVARFAMELLAEAGICVILSCSKELLAAVARCTGSEVALSVEQLTPRCVATCRAFRAEDPYRPLRLKSSRPPRMPATNRVVSFFAPPPPAPLPVDPDLGRPEMGLAIFEDCPLRLGSTILLQGGSDEELSKIKRVVQFLCYMLSHSVRECALLSYVLLATLPPIRSPTTNKMLPLVGRETLAGAHQAVRHMAELTKAARGSEPILSVSPHVVPLHARQGAALRGVRDLDDGALQMHQLQGDHPVLGGRVFAQSSDDNLPQPGCPGSGAKHRSYKSYCQGDVREDPASSNVAGRHQRSFTHQHVPVDRPPQHLRSVSQMPPSNETAQASHPQLPAKQSQLPPWACPDSTRSGAHLLYGWQRLYYNTSSMHPGKALQCLAPEVRRVDFYTASDIPLFKFVSSLDKGAPIGQNASKSCLLPPERCPYCNEGAQEHIYTLLHGVGRVTVAIKRLAAGSELPGSANQRLWLWSRAGGVAPKPQAAVNKGEKGSSKQEESAALDRAAADPAVSDARRIPLCSESAYMSMGQFLSLAFGGLHLGTMDSGPLWEGRVLYLGLGRTVVAFHTERHKPQVVLLPALGLSYVPEKQAAWIRSEVEEVEAQATKAFDALKALLTANCGGDESADVLLSSLQSTGRRFHEDIARAREGLIALDEMRCLATISQINTLRKDLCVKILEWASLLLDPLAKCVQAMGNEVVIRAPTHQELTSALSASSVANNVCKTHELLGDGRDSPSPASGPLESPLSSRRRAQSFHLSDVDLQQLEEPMESLPKATTLSRGHRRTASAEMFNFRDMEFASIAGEMERDSFVPPLPLRHLQKWLDRSSSGSCSQLPEVSKEHLNDGIPCSMGEEFRSLPGTPVDTPGSPAASSNCSSPSMPPRQPNLLKASRLGPGQSEPGSIACRLSDPGPPSLTDAHQSSPAPSMKPSASCNRLYDCAVAGPQSPTQVADAVKHAPLHLKGRCTMPPGLDDMVLPVYDDEPTSVVAHLLMSPQYNQWITDLQAKLHKTRSAGSTPEDRLSDSGMRSGTLSPLRESPSPETTSEGAAQPKIESETSGSASPLSVMHSRNSSADLPATAPSPLTLPHSRPGHSRGNSIVDAIFGGFQGVGVMSRDAPGPAADMEEPWQGEEEWCNLVSTEPYHFTGTFTDSAHQGSQSKVATFSVAAYFALQFAHLRWHVMGGDSNFVASLSRCRPWQSQGGKSNAYFAKTMDDRFVIKQMSKVEKQAFLEFGPEYFRYLAECMHKGRPTCLAKILGVYEVGIKVKTLAGTAGNGKGKTCETHMRVMDVLVMENIFYGHSISRIYDLKGSLRHRYNADFANPRAVLLDENLLESMMEHPLCVDAGGSANLEAALWTDTAFLSRLGVMDYSLIVGVDAEESTLVVGIIDFIRQYTLDKQFETFLKSSGLLGGAGQQPTVVSPKHYMRRFRAAMSSYFTVMPDSDPQQPHLNPDS